MYNLTKFLIYENSYRVATLWRARENYGLCESPAPYQQSPLSNLKLY